MTDPQVAILMLCLFIVLVLLGFPIAFTLIAMGVAFGYYAYFTGAPDSIGDIFNNNIFYLLNQNTYSVMENDILVAIPLFLFMGYVVERANIVDKLFYSLYQAASNLPGSLGIAALLTCAVFSTASGIVGAVVTLMGLLAYPAMNKAGYDKSFASGIICAGGTLGILIPPSIMLIVYAAIAELSPLRLYAAAVFPGLLLAGLYIVYVIIRVTINPGLAPKPLKEDIPPRSTVYYNLLVSFVPLTVLIMLVLGSILGGLATPAEAAAMGALGGLAQIIIFLLGWPLEWSEILIIFVPIFLPMLETFGVNPYFFAMLVALNLQTSFLTPPMAMSAYYLKGVLKKQIELMEIFKGLMPYLAIVIFCMVLMYQFPGIALWFPDYLFGTWVP